METFTASQTGYLIIVLGIPVALGILAWLLLAVDALIFYLRYRN